MIIVTGLKCVCLTYNKTVTPDGVYQKGNDFYLTFIHGGRDGSISLECDGFFYDLEPWALRDAVRDYFGYQIPENGRIVLMCCYSKIVRARWQKEFEKHNIVILPNWTSLTRMAVVNPNHVMHPLSVVFVETFPNKEYHILLDYKPTMYPWDYENILKGKKKGIVV